MAGTASYTKHSRNTGMGSTKSTRLADPVCPRCRLLGGRARNDPVHDFAGGRAVASPQNLRGTLPTLNAQTHLSSELASPSERFSTKDANTQEGNGQHHEGTGLRYLGDITVVCDCYIDKGVGGRDFKRPKCHGRAIGIIGSTYGEYVALEYGDAGVLDWSK